jgi:hypothetical protein
MKSARNTAKRWCDGIALAFWLAFGLACLLNWARPGMSFDLTPYLGLTAAADVTNDAQVQASSYEELHKVATPQQWSDLTESNPYVQQMKDNPSLFSRDLDVSLHIASLDNTRVSLDYSWRNGLAGLVI